MCPAQGGPHQTDASSIHPPIWAGPQGILPELRQHLPPPRAPEAAGTEAAGPAQPEPRANSRVTGRGAVSRGCVPARAGAGREGGREKRIRIKSKACASPHRARPSPESAAANPGDVLRRRSFPGRLRPSPAHGKQPNTFIQGQTLQPIHLPALTTSGRSQVTSWLG